MNVQQSDCAAEQSLKLLQVSCIGGKPLKASKIVNLVNPIVVNRSIYQRFLGKIEDRVFFGFTEVSNKASELLTAVLDMFKEPFVGQCILGRKPLPQHHNYLISHKIWGNSDLRLLFFWGHVHDPASTSSCLCDKALFLFGARVW